MKKKIILITAMMAMALAVYITGCSKSAQNQPIVLESGQIVLTVNPEIAVHYNKKGLTTSIEGVNKDGKSIVENVNDYVGRDCREVVKDIVKEINEAGYFVADENGVYNDITIRVVSGSHIPSDDFLDDITVDVKQTVEGMNLGADISVRRSDSDYGRTDYNNDSNYGNSSSNDSGYNDSSEKSTRRSNTNGDSDYDSPTNKSTRRATGNSDSGYGSPSTKPAARANGNSDSGYRAPTTKTPAVKTPVTRAVPRANGNSDSGYGDSDYQAPTRPAPQPTTPPTTAAPQPTTPPTTAKPAPAPRAKGNSDSDYGNSGYSGYGGNSGYSGYGNS